MFAEERKEKIMELLRQNKRTSIGELTEMFQVSGTTIRTYLTELEKAGKLVRTHGGAMLNEDVLDMEESISARKDKRMEEKQKIAKTARAMIEDGDMILLDSGTTTLELAKLLKDANNLTVVTNDLQIALELQRHQGIYLIFLETILNVRWAVWDLSFWKICLQIRLLCLPMPCPWPKVPLLQIWNRQRSRKE